MGWSAYLIKKTLHRLVQSFLEAPPGFEPGIKVLQTLALPLGDSAILACPKAFDKKIKTVRMLERETRFEPATFTLAR